VCGMRGLEAEPGAYSGTEGRVAPNSHGWLSTRSEERADGADDEGLPQV
jgi:hypothetical protein